jgi:hypothetical protein
MKTRFLPLLVPLLLCGCAQSVVLSPSPATLHATQTSTISVQLMNGNVAPNIAQTVELETESAAPFGSSLTTTIRTTAGAGSAVVTAAVVDRNTTVTIEGEWEVVGWNPSGSTTVEVLPPIVESPKIGESYIAVSPSASPSWTYVYDITSRSAGGVPPDLTGCTITFAVPVTLTLVQATNPLIGAITLTPSSNADGTVWYMGGGATFQNLIVQAVVADGSPGGTTTVTGHEGATTSYVATVTGPQP